MINKHSKHAQVALIQFRLQKAKSDLRAAQLLHQHQLPNAALNRCYYALFHAAKAVLVLHNKNVRKHHKVINRFILLYLNTNTFNAKFIPIIKEAEKARTSSDYQDFFDPSIINLNERLQQCEAFVKLIEQHIAININNC